MFNAYLFAFHKPLCPVPYPARCLPLNESIHRLCHVNAKRERVPSLSSFMAPHHYNLPALALSSFACPRWYECVWSVCETVFVFMLSFASICLSLFAHCRYGHRIWGSNFELYSVESTLGLLVEWLLRSSHCLQTPSSSMESIAYHDLFLSFQISSSRTRDLPDW